MKKFLFIIMSIIMISSVNVFSQTKQYSVPEDMLTEQQKAKINEMQKTKEIDNQFENVSKWTGMGKEIGEATSGAL